MKLFFPSPEFDQAVADVCHGSIDEELASALNQLLRENPAARDEYILRTALHARLASDSDLFANLLTDAAASSVNLNKAQESGDPQCDSNPVRFWQRRELWAAAWIVMAVILGALFLDFVPGRPELQPVDLTGGSTASVAMLDQTVEAKWGDLQVVPQLGDPLAPGKLNLESGWVQILFYSGARVVIEGPAVFELIDSSSMIFSRGRLIAEISPQAGGFRMSTPHAVLKESGSAVSTGFTESFDRSGDFKEPLETAFGLDVAAAVTELHLFEGRVQLETVPQRTVRELEEGTAVAVEDDQAFRSIFMDAWKFASLFELQQRSMAAETLRYETWRESIERLNKDSSLLLRLDFENQPDNHWRLRNTSQARTSITAGTVIGCQWTSGRWINKQALGFQNVNDRVRLIVPGEYDSLTFALWVRVQGLDRRINSLFMSDGFEPGTIHWSIRNDGVMGLTLIGPERRNFVLSTSPPVLTLDRIGKWVHLAAVVDGPGRRLIQYVNGQLVAEDSHHIAPPYNIGESELGNWNAEGFVGADPFLIRNFSGAMDEFCLFGSALNGEEIRELYRRGKPQSEFSGSQIQPKIKINNKLNE